VEAVIATCQLLAKTSNLAKPSLLYYANNKERMGEVQFRAAGYLIGRGVLESGCKQIVAQRLKLPGAQWNAEGAVLTAKARTAWMSGNWHKLVSAPLPFTSRRLTIFACTLLPSYKQGERIVNLACYNFCAL
jgi:hypothetical protein